MKLNTNFSSRGLCIKKGFFAKARKNIKFLSKVFKDTQWVLQSGKNRVNLLFYSTLTGIGWSDAIKQMIPWHTRMKKKHFPKSVRSVEIVSTKSNHQIQKLVNFNHRRRKSSHLVEEASRKKSPPVKKTRRKQNSWKKILKPCCARTLEDCFVIRLYCTREDAS